MKKRFSEEQIVGFLREAQIGAIAIRRIEQCRCFGSSLNCRVQIGDYAVQSFRIKSQRETRSSLPQLLRRLRAVEIVGIRSLHA